MNNGMINGMYFLDISLNRARILNRGTLLTYRKDMAMREDKSLRPLVPLSDCPQYPLRRYGESLDRVSDGVADGIGYRL